MVTQTHKLTAPEIAELLKKAKKEEKVTFDGFIQRPIQQQGEIFLATIIGLLLIGKFGFEKAWELLSIDSDLEKVIPLLEIDTPLLDRLIMTSMTLGLDAVDEVLKKA